jgi:hypothetical protein
MTFYLKPVWGYGHMLKRPDRFARFVILAVFLLTLAVDIFSMDITALNGVWNWNIMAVGNGKREYNFSWGKGKFNDGGVFFDLKENTAGIYGEGLFEIRELKQEDANTVIITIYYDLKKNRDIVYGKASSGLTCFTYMAGVPDRRCLLRVHFENYNKIRLKILDAYWGKFEEGEGSIDYRVAGPSREVAGADFEPMESLFGERSGDFCYTADKEAVTVTKYLNNSADKVDIPSVINSMPVKTIGYGAFAYRSNLKFINIPYGVTHIEDFAFTGTGLTSVVIPGGVVSIGVTAFLNCTELKSVVLPNSITAIKNGVFGGCTNLETITLPKSVSDIGSWAFSDCKRLKVIELPAGLSSIGEKAFEQCTSLETIELPAGLSYIGDGAFQYCSSLKTITIPKGVKQISPRMFYYCDNLISVRIFRWARGGTEIKRDDIIVNTLREEEENFMKKVKIEYIINVGVLNDDSVRIRAEPNLSGEIKGFVNRMDKVEILEIGRKKQRIEGMRSVWYRIITAGNVEGWVFGAYIDIVE